MANSSLPKNRKDRINPVTVPNKPSNGASVTNVSITVRNRPARLISIPAATCKAPCNDACGWFKPFHIIRRTGSRESRESREASATSPTSMAVKTFSIRFGSRRIQRPSHQKMRSSTTARAVRETTRIGHMIGPPFLKLSTKKFLSRTPPDSVEAGVGVGVAVVAAVVVVVVVAGDMAAVDGLIPATGDIPGAVEAGATGFVPATEAA